MLALNQLSVNFLRPPLSEIKVLTVYLAFASAVTAAKSFNAKLSKHCTEGERNLLKFVTNISSVVEN